MNLFKKHPLFIYISLMLFFAGIYNITWHYDPDSFIKNNELNSRPFRDALSLAFFSDDLEIRTKEEVTKPQFIEKVPQLLKKHFELQNYDEIINSKILDLEKQRYQNSIKMENALAKNIEDYKIKSILELNLKLSSELKKKEVNLKLQSKLGNGSLERSIYGNTLALIDLEIAKIRLDIAKKELEVSKYIIPNIKQFQDITLIRKLDKINELLELEREKRIKNQSDMIDLRSSAQRLLQNLKKDDLNYWDFLYYSIGISTTTTFGDLIANSRTIRFIVCIQLLTSIFLLASLTQSFVTRK